MRAYMRERWDAPTIYPGHPPRWGATPHLGRTRGGAGRIVGYSTGNKPPTSSPPLPLTFRPCVLPLPQPPPGPRDMSAVQLQNVRLRHQAIADWLIANPDRSQGECASAFGITQAWLSVIVNSDIFREYLQQRLNEVSTPVMFTLREKLMGVAHRAVEKLGSAVDNSQDPDFILEAADKTLHRLGYAPTRGPVAAPTTVTNQQNNIYVVDRETLDGARRRYLQAVGVKVALPAPEGVPAGGTG